MPGGEGLAAGRASALPRRVLERWREPHRHYRTVAHLDACAAAWETWRGELRRPWLVGSALAYHDLVFDPRRGDNETRAAALARSELGAVGLAAERAAARPGARTRRPAAAHRRRTRRGAPMTDPEILHAGRHLDLVRRGRWEYARRRGVRAVVAIVALTAEGELLLVEQHRVPVDARVIELPAGLVGDQDADESPLTAAGRELEEETGYRAASFCELARGPASAGLSDEVVTLVRARGLVRTGSGGGVAGEDIAVQRVPLASAPEWLAQRAADGALIDPKVFAGLWWIAQQPG